MINLNNHTYELGGENLEDVLAALEIDESKVDLRQDGKTLHILEKTGTKGARFEGVEMINLNNHTYELGGENLEDVLAALEIDENKVDLRQDGKTLHILERTGTKGILSEDMSESIEDATNFIVEPIDSSFIEGLAYNSDANGQDRTLLVFMSGDIVYKYSFVPLTVINDFINAPSAGSFFSNNIAYEYLNAKLDFDELLNGNFVEITLETTSRRRSPLNDIQAKLQNLLGNTPEETEEEVVESSDELTNLQNRLSSLLGNTPEERVFEFSEEDLHLDDEEEYYEDCEENDDEDCEEDCEENDDEDCEENDDVLSELESKLNILLSHNSQRDKSFEELKEKLFSMISKDVESPRMDWNSENRLENNLMEARDLVSDVEDELKDLADLLDDIIEELF